MKKSTFQASPWMVSVCLVVLFILFWQFRISRLPGSEMHKREGLHPLAAKYIDADVPAKRSAFFVVYGSGAAADEVMRRAGHAWFASSERGLRGFDPDTKGHIVLLSSADWADFSGNRAHEPARRSGQVDRTILLVREPGQPHEMSDVAHEVVHFRLEDAGLPLWYEEGLAMHLGIEITLAFEQIGGRRAAEDPEPERERRATDASIMDFDAYPEDPAILAGYYRHCRIFVKALDLSKTQLHELTLALGKGAAWESILHEQFSFTEKRMDELKDLARITIAVDERAVE